MLSRPALLLRLEEIALFVLVVAFYSHLHFSWVLFACLFLAPDLFMIGYAAGPKIGSATYNFAHTLFVPLVLFGAGWLLNSRFSTPVALIWIAHIAFDRLLGYGLKYPTFFKDTHLHHVS